MEVSSHALALHRVDGTRFAAAVFTNLGADHLDLHGTAEEYFRAKARLFTPELAAVGVTNVDDAHGRLLLDAAPIEMVPYSLADAADVVVDRRPPRVHVARRAPRGRARRRVQRRQHARRGDDGGRARHRARRRSPPGWPPPPRPGPLRARRAGHRRRRRDRRDRRLRPHARRPGARSSLAARGSTGGRVIVVFGAGGDRDHAKRPRWARSPRAAPTASS